MVQYHLFSMFLSGEKVIISLKSSYLSHLNVDFHHGIHVRTHLYVNFSFGMINAKQFGSPCNVPKLGTLGSDCTSETQRLA